MNKPIDIEAHLASLRNAAQQLQAAIQPAVPFVMQMAVSMGAYTAGLAGSQALGLALRISCASPVAGPVAGLLGVGFASALAGQAGKRCSLALQERQGARPAASPATPRVDWREVALDAALGVALFKVMGGRFRSVMPSDLARVGAIARESLPAKGREYIADGQRHELLRFLRRDGCHHCGNRRGLKVVGDHMPPNKHVKQAQAAAGASCGRVLTKLPGGGTLASGLGLPTGPPRQRFFPQCSSCSQKQADAIRNSKTILIIHEVLHRGGSSTAWHWAGAMLGLRHLHTSSSSSSNSRRVRRGGWRGAWG